MPGGEGVGSFIGIEFFSCTHIHFTSSAKKLTLQNNDQLLNTKRGGKKYILFRVAQRTCLEIQLLKLKSKIILAIQKEVKLRVTRFIKEKDNDAKLKLNLDSLSEDLPQEKT